MKSSIQSDEFTGIVAESLTDVGPANHADVLTEETARQFFGSLYEDGQDVRASWSGAVTPLVAKLGNNVVSGEQALQSLMVNFVLKNAQDLGQVKKVSAALAGIKRVIVGEVLQEFPHATVEELIRTAKDAGYEVQVLAS